MTPRAERTTISLIFGGVTGITAVAISLRSYAPAMAFRGFVVAASVTWAYLLVILASLRRHLAASGEPAVLSLPTWVTLGRGFLIALVAGLAAGELPARGLPGALYGVAALADLADGALARRTGRVTALGARLDVTTDAVGLFVAPVAGVRWGLLPPWYLLLAGAYPAFRLALRLRRARGLPTFVDRLKRDPRARFFAAVQMTVVAGALLDVLPRALVWTVATVAMLPTLALFAGEWRLVARSAQDGGARAERLHA